MSPKPTRRPADDPRFPRVSGDEPSNHAQPEPAPEPTSDGVYLFSPRERG